MAPTGGTSGVGPKTGAALRDVAARGDVQRVGVMLQSCAAVINDTDENGCTALQRAAADGHSEVVRLLMQNGADPNRQDSMHGNTALHEAAWKGYSRCVTLLATRAALHIRNNGGFAPLHLACQNGHNQTCREILLAGCDPDIQNNYGDTSLHTSARYGHAGVTRILISAECHVSDQNKNGDTALHIAAAMGRRKLTRILLEAGCNKGLKNKQNETAKDIAIRKELHEIVDILTTSVVKAKKEKDNKKKEKHRDKSVEKVIDTPDAAVLESIVKKKSKDKDASQSPGKSCKDKKKLRSVHFEANGKHWSPYGCHYYPDPSNFPKPKLDSLPKEPLKKGEQYFLDLAGNICKGPVGVGYTCYCAPFFKHMEDKLNRDKLELKYHIDKAHEKLDQKVTNLERRTQGQISELTRCVAAERVLCRERQQHLEHWLTRGMMFRVSERAKKLDFSPKGSVDIAPLKRTRSLEMLDTTSKTWNIIKTFNSNVKDTPPRTNLNRSMRNASKSADVLDTNSPRVSRKFNKCNDVSESSHNKSYRASSKSSDRSISISSYGAENPRKGGKSDSVHNVTAEIHVKTNNANVSQSYSQSDCDSTQSRMNRSKTEIDLKEIKSIVEEKEMDQLNNCLDGIENDGYIKISRCEDGSRCQMNGDGVVVENGSRRSVHELVARIQQKQIIEEIERSSLRDSRSPGGRSSGSASRSMSPSYRMNPSQFPSPSDWQNNTIPLSENTHFNTIEPISQSVQINTSGSNKPVQSVKSSKKFSFHNLIPFPTRKMFNFHNKSDGNRSESSDEEDNPVRTPLESGLMQNSNLLTTVPLPNYENMNQNAQPQSPNKLDANGKINPLSLRSLLPIPKDAYFHDVPNKQRFLESQMFSRLPNQNVHPHFKTPDVSKSSDNINYSRNRNPVYSSNGLLSEMMHDHIDRELSRTPHSYTSQLDQNAEIEISNINNCSGYHNNMRPLNNYQSHGHLINEVRGTLESQMMNYPHDPHLQNRMQNLAINTQLTELQSQLDRDSHNDSGYSTKVYGSSQGASPSLSGNIDCSESTLNQKLALVMNRNIITNTVNHPPHTHIGASSLV